MRTENELTQPMPEFEPPAASICPASEPQPGQRILSSSPARIVKALADGFLALLLLAVLSPILLVAALAILLEDGFPIIHCRIVQGQNGTFPALKLRTMVKNADELLKHRPELMAEYRSSYKIAKDPRISKVGRILRPLNIDELPQLWNVLAGQMSLIGPRMKTPPEFEAYGSYAQEVLSVKPGISGLWQTTIRHKASYQERIQADLHYVRNWSLLLDAKIVLLTLRTIIGRRGDS
jgi:lipopolysaccharide/colanic/teichoic acid biosynthesis glycosyltransferase